MGKSEIIVKSLLCEIRAGLYCPDMPFPGDIAISRRFNVSRETARKGLESLKSAGLIRSRRGSGTVLSCMQNRTIPFVGVIATDDDGCDCISQFQDEVAELAFVRGFAVAFEKCRSRTVEEFKATVVNATMRLVGNGAAGIVYMMGRTAICASEFTDLVLSLSFAAGVYVVLASVGLDSTPEVQGCDRVLCDMFQAGVAVGGMLFERGISDVALVGGPLGRETYSYLATGFNFKGIFEIRNATSVHDCRSSNADKSRRRTEMVAHVFLDADGSESSAEGIAVKPDRKAMAMASINCLLSRILLPSRQPIDVRVTPIIVGLNPSGYSDTSM